MALNSRLWFAGSDNV